MPRKTPLLIALMAISFACHSADPKAFIDFPTHCKSGEFAYLNAKMARVERPDKGGYKLIPTSKVISICAGQEKEPFSKVTYRYGQIGKIELETVATNMNRFGITSRTTSPRTGENLIFFSNDNYNYYVGEATGQGSGVSLVVFKSGKKILDLFSGNNYGSDYVSRLINIDFYKANSPVFMVQNPTDELY